jgi:CBS domain-containing protein
MKVKEILKNKGPEVFTISENKSLRDAIKILVNNNIGALIVLNDSASITGIVTERDILHESFRNPDSYMDSPIGEVMTRNLIIVEPDDEIEYVESIMTQNRIRHLPVVYNKVLVGLISIGDVVKTQLNEFRHELKYLKDYIEGNFS